MRASPTDSADYLAGVEHAKASEGQGVDVDSWRAAPSAELLVTQGVPCVGEGARDADEPRRRPSPKLLREFVNLRQAEDAAVVAYARHWGMLELCYEHGLPISLGGPVVLANPSFDNETFWDRVGKPLELHNPGYFLAADERCTLASAEPVDAWRDWAGIFGGIVEISRSTARDMPASVASWEAVGVQPTGLGSMHLERSALGAYLRWLIQLADLRLTVDWLAESTNSGGAGLRLAPILTTRSLFAGLTSELVGAIAAPAKYAFCLECGLLYAPSRKTAKRNFCPACNDDGAPGRWAARDYYERKQQRADAPTSEQGDRK